MTQGHEPMVTAGYDSLTAEVKASRVADLSHPLYEGMPTWPGGGPFTMIRLMDYPQGCQYHRFEMAENTGTHLDAPSHFIAGKRSIDQIPLRDLVVPAVVVKLSHRVEADPDHRCSAGDLIAWETVFGEIPAGSLVILNTGWHKRFTDPARYMNQGSDGRMHFPGFDTDAATHLIQRKVAGVGIDTPSIDHGPSRDYPAHKLLLAANIYQIENMANLDALPGTGATVVVGVLNVLGGSEAPARILALLP